MRLARVVGNVISTVKDEGYQRYKLMLVEYFDPVTGKAEGSRMIACDCACSGVGDIVVVNTDGGAGNMLMDDDYGIFDLVICGVVDHYTAYGKTEAVS